MLRLLLIIFLFLLSLLTVFPAPTWHLWLVAILVTEFCWIFSIITLALLFWQLKTRRFRLAGLTLGLTALALYLSPLISAYRVGQNLEQELRLAFGRLSKESIQQKPFSLQSLFGRLGFRDIPYKTLSYHSGKHLSLDFYPSQVAGFRPCIVVIHGGSWRSGDSRQLPELNSHLAQRGYHVASVNYSKAPAYRYPAALDDVKLAVQYLLIHAAELQLDTTNIFLLGRSAGAQIALMAAYTSATPIKGVISFYGPADMVWGYSLPANPLVMDSRGVMRDYLGGSYEEVSQQYAASSATLAVRQNAPPTLMIHGLNDPLVAYEHNIRLMKKLQQYDVPHYLLTLPWGTHGFDYSLHGPGGQLSSYTVEYFLRAVAGSSEQ